MGIASVSVYSEPDREALHVRNADEAYLLGPGPAAESYLNIPKLIDVAKRAGVNAIHPGYGFLAENADFAQACVDNHIVFVGPSPHSIRLLGDKSVARTTMGRAGVPLVPGTDNVTDIAVALAFAERAGYPMLVKATGGGGGRGIRVVPSADDLPNALDAAGAEALQAFGNGACYLEKYLNPVRHVEVQIMADTHGNVVGLGERECSLQRRHQKIVEEAPSVAVTPALRERLIAAAVTAAKAADYHGAGTVEFLLDGSGDFYFLEANTRLQVEHPVTEMLTGQDLVRDQLMVAAGDRLSYTQADIRWNGAAMECRVTAEDPENGFLPSLGRVRLLSEPSGPGVRVDSCLYDGMEVSPFYDSLLAKVIVWGQDRAQVIARMQRALSEYAISGVKTNLPFHNFLLNHPSVQSGDISTSFVEGLLEGYQEQGRGTDDLAAVIAAVLTHTKGVPMPMETLTDGRPARSPWATAFRPGRDGRWR